MKPSGPSGSVIAAGVVAILASLVTILIAVAAIAGVSLMPPAGSSPPIPQSVKSTAVAMMVFLAGLAIFGIFTSVGVLHLKNWARVSILIWGAVMAAFSGLALPFAAFMPMPEAPAQSPVALPFVRTLLLIVYGIPFLIGVWWLLLFNQRAIKEQFLAPALGDGQLAAPARPRCPLPLAILAFPRQRYFLQKGRSKLSPADKMEKPARMARGNGQRGLAGAASWPSPR